MRTCESLNILNLYRNLFGTKVVPPLGWHNTSVLSHASWLSYRKRNGRKEHISVMKRRLKFEDDYEINSRFAFAAL